MEAKKFISTLKGFKTRFSKSPNVELEKKSVTTLIGKLEEGLEASTILNDFGDVELTDYFNRVMGLTDSTEKIKSETPKKKVGRVVYVDADGIEHAEVDGKHYVIDSVKNTIKRVYKDLKDIGTDIDLSLSTMPMTVYQKYLRERFPGEDMPIKKGKLLFRGYRISCTAEDGFIVEDTLNHYEVVETSFEGIPTPKELGDWFDKSKQVTKTETYDDYKKAVERGKELARKSKEEAERNAAKSEEVVAPDFETLRKKVLKAISNARSGSKVDPETIIDVIPFKRWRRKVKSFYTQWKNRKIRYARFLNEVEKITKEETFVVEEKRHRSAFTGTMLPEHTKVGLLVEDKIEVDGKWVDAVPFLLDYLLFHEKRAMSQIMKFAKGEITDRDLIKSPLEVDWKVEYDKRALENTAHNARVLCMVYDQVGIVAPQDLLYEADLQVGDRIMISVDGELKTQTVSSVEKGITLGKEIGLLKLDKWIKISSKAE